MSDIKTVVHSLAEKFGGQVSEYAEDFIISLSAETILPAAQSLRGDFGFELLSDITTVDYWPEESPRFHMIYRFTSVANRQVLNIRVPLAGTSPTMPTLEGIYHSANWYEREIFDMFGIKFEGHSDMRRLLMPFDWQGHPLRKDYPLGYEEPQYSFNFDEIAARKPFARE